MTNKQAKGNSKQKKGSFLKDMLIILLSAIAIATFLKLFIVDSRVVPSSSMYPTIQIGDRIILNKLAYLGSLEPERGDIIVCKPPAELNSRYDLVKRIIGLPGETLEVKNGLVYINGEPIEEDYLNEVPIYTYNQILIPDDCYFLLGDNRNQSLDSHYWADPFIDISDIKGKVVGCYWPISEIGAL